MTLLVCAIAQPAHDHVQLCWAVHPGRSRCRRGYAKARAPCLGATSCKHRRACPGPLYRSQLLPLVNCNHSATSETDTCPHGHCPVQRDLVNMPALVPRYGQRRCATCGNGVSIRLEQPIGWVSGCWNHAGTHMALWAEEASTWTCRYNMKLQEMPIGVTKVFWKRESTLPCRNNKNQ